MYFLCEPMKEEKWGREQLEHSGIFQAEDCFTYRGKVWVKGKGHMDTYYFKEPK